LWARRKRNAMKDFRITGIVSERQSGNPVQGVLVVAYDKDPLFDDLLGTCETDDKGRFTITYVKRNAGAHFGKSLDLYLAVFAPPCQMLADTSSCVRWGATHKEFFNLTVDAEKLKASIEEASEDVDLDADIMDGLEWEVC
jgi:hypothetical protein